MRRIRSTGTKAERLVRSLLHKLGYRYRVAPRDLPGKPDVVFSRKKKVIFVHGCFWHQHPQKACLDGRLPKSRLDYWIPKLERNVNRDKQHLATLQEMGWKALVIWECEVGDRNLKARLVKFLGPPRSSEFSV